jgi:hypothetical protein
VHYRLSLDREAGQPINGKTEAQAEAERLRHAIREGTFRPQRRQQPGESPTSITFRQFADIYIEEHVKKFCKPSAMRNIPSQRRRVEPILVPSGTGNLIPFGDKPIVDITTEDLEMLDVALLAVKPRQRRSTGGASRGIGLCSCSRR